MGAGRSLGQQPCSALGLLKGEPEIQGMPSPFGLPTILAACVGAGEADSHRPPSAKTNIPSPSNPHRGRIRTATPAVNISDAGISGLHPPPPTGPLVIPTPGTRLTAPACAAAGAACTFPCCLHPFLLPVPFLQPSDTSAAGSARGGASAGLAGCHPLSYGWPGPVRRTNCKHMVPRGAGGVRDTPGVSAGSCPGSASIPAPSQRSGRCQTGWWHGQGCAAASERVRLCYHSHGEHSAGLRLAENPHCHAEPRSRRCPSKWWQRCG